MEKLIDFAKFIARLLNIKMPKIVFDVNYEWGSDDYRPEDDTITIVEEIDSRESYFAIAHELRHKWQWVCKNSEFFENYKQKDEVSEEEYLMQKAEVDSNAFAMVAMILTSEYVPQFKNYTDNVRKRIFKRAEEICIEHNVEFPWDEFYNTIGIYL